MAKITSTLYTKRICDKCAPLSPIVGHKAEMTARGWESWWEIRSNIDRSKFIEWRAKDCLGCHEVDMEYYTVLYAFLFKLKVYGR